MSNTLTVNQAEQANQTNKVYVTVAGREEVLEQQTLGITMESTERQILDAVDAIIQELRDDDGEYSFTVRKILATNSILIFPKPTAGS